ncbi:MAG: N-acetylmuramoyl-L-alanine amidase [Deltaproteobacteria bacterium]
MNIRVVHIIKYLSLTLAMVFIVMFAVVLDAEAGQGLINYDVINIRSGPGTNYQIAGKILKDSQVNILQTQGDWKQISYGKVTGWIAAQYVNVVGIGDIVITGDWANIRSGPGTSFSAVGRAIQGETFTLLSREGDWYHILTSGGQEAYIVGYLARIGQPGNTSGSVVVNTKTTDPTASTNTASATSTASAKSSKGISVFLDGKLLSFEVAPMVENGRTLVPLRAIFEAMGASVDWNEKTRTVTASKGSDVVVLPINSTTPTVNGKKYALEVPAKIVKGRTLAPLRFVAEAFGGQVDWNQAAQKVAITSGNTSSNSGSNNNDRPAAVTAKIQDVSLRDQPSGSGTALSIAHPGERLAVLNERDGWYQVSRGSTTAWVASWLVEATAASGDTTSGPNTTAIIPGNTGSAIDTTVTEGAATVRIAKTCDSKGIRITLSSEESFKPEIKESGGSIQYELGDIPLAAFSGLDESIGDGKLIVSKGDGNVVSISLPDWIEYKLSSENSKKYIISIPNYITSIEKTAFGSVGDRLIIHSIGPIQGQTATLEGSDLVIKLPDIKVKSGYKFYSTGMLFSNVEFTQSGNDLLLRISTSNIGRYSFANSGTRKELNIILMRSIVKKSGEKVVVLDPGHGGTAPGSSGSFLKEKDVNLAVALKVGDLLQQRGIKVEYTRTGDTTMSLSEEVEVGNAADATVFVSMHCNSSNNPGPSGTETYFYAPLEDPELYVQREERSRLANLIQSKMIARIGLVDRGVKDNQAFYVLNHTSMPSALVEMGFINNPEEEKLLAQEETREQIAYAIADAIQEYLQSL